ncbi:MAG: carnitine 3-dehydrogenase [Gammaproteobacteria bacterium]|jgi:carnitine 3-dehydrogenase
MQLRDPLSVKRVAVLGAGTIGASWAAHFLGQGMQVQIWDPAPGGEQRATQFINTAWEAVERLGLRDGADRQNFAWHDRLESALDGVDFVQESAPENREIKIALYRQIDDALANDVVMSTSTSGLIMSELQDGLAGAGRFVVGHPFNPPHLIPLVEVLGGKQSHAACVDWALAFYNAFGKKAIRLNKEVPGHLVNRIQAALWREAMDAVLSGLASMDDVDTAIAYGPGLRWGVMGPFRLCALAGGTGGYEHFLDHFGDNIEDWWSDMRDVSLTPEVRAELTAKAQQAFGSRDINELAAERDTLVVGIMQTLAQARKENGYD